MANPDIADPQQATILPARVPTQRHAIVMLVAATFCWGMTFPLVKNWQQVAGVCPGGDVLASLTLIGIRLPFALALFAIIRPQLVKGLSRRDVLLGFVLGLVNVVGFILQVVGLAQTTPALSGFLTSLASAWVPILGFVLFRTSVRRATLFGLGLGIAGATVLGMSPDQAWSMGGGESLTLIGSFIFGLVIVLVDRVGRSVSPGHLTVGFLAGTGIPALALAFVWAVTGPGIGAWLSWTHAMVRNLTAVRDLVLLTIFGSVLATHWFTMYQPRVSAGRAALIYLLEPVFASSLSILWGHDRLTSRLVLGGSLILLGNVLVELPVWYRDFQNNREKEAEPSTPLR